MYNDVNCLDKYGNTPLDRVFTFNKSDVKKSLIALFENHGAKPKELEALINAARKEDVEAVKKLLKDDNIDLSNVKPWEKCIALGSTKQ